MGKKRSGSHARETFHKASRVIGDLFVPWQWTAGTITDFLNAETDEERRLLTDLFVTTTLTNYNTIGVTVRIPSSRLSAEAHANDLTSVSTRRRRHLWSFLLVQCGNRTLDRQSGMVLRPDICVRIRQCDRTVQRLTVTSEVPFSQHREDQEPRWIPEDSDLTVDSTTVAVMDLGLSGLAIEIQHRLLPHRARN